MFVTIGFMTSLTRPQGEYRVYFCLRFQLLKALRTRVLCSGCSANTIQNLPDPSTNEALKNEIRKKWAIL